jgi:hypothetical protein
MASRTPPRFVPTLTEVVQASAPVPLAPTPVAPAVQPAQEQVAQRVLQRIDLALERRLRETIAGVVAEQTRSIAPLLRERLEATVRELVAEALAEELQARQRGDGQG